MWFPGKRQVRAIALALLLPALMFRAAIPVGYMPSLSATGQPALVMCSAVDVTALVTQDVDADQDGNAGRHGTDGARGSGPCHFSASMALAPLPESGWSARLDIPLAFVARHNTVEVHAPAIVRTQSSRGPPALRYF